MQLQTILNRVQKFPSHVYKVGRLVGERAKTIIEVDVAPRAGGKILGSRRGQPAPGDEAVAKPRRFSVIPLWNLPVVFPCCMRGVK
jgi:hypothetical protein